MNRRKGLLLVTAVIVVWCWYSARFDGDPKPVEPLLVAPLHEAPAWRSQPALLQNINEPTAVYIVSGLPGSDGLFEALRLDVNSGARSSARIQFGPDTTYRPFDSAEVVGIPAIEFRGLMYRRPTLHLFSFLGPGGPGFHFVDSATGVLHIVAGTGKSKRTLLTLTLINSSSVPEIRPRLWSDRSRRLAAFLWREANIWNLYLFSLIPTAAVRENRNDRDHRRAAASRTASIGEAMTEQFSNVYDDRKRSEAYASLEFPGMYYPAKE